MFLNNIILADFSELSEKLKEIVNKLIPSWPSLVAQLLSLAVLLVVVIFIAYKPVKKMLKKRGDYIESQIKDAENEKIKSKKNAIESEKILLESKKEADDIILQANLTIEANRKLAIEETQKEIIKMKEEASKDIEKSKKEALEDIKKEMVNIALEASEEILKRNINDEDNKKLTNDFIEDLKK